MPKHSLILVVTGLIFAAARDVGPQQPEIATLHQAVHIAHSELYKHCRWGRTVLRGMLYTVYQKLTITSAICLMACAAKFVHPCLQYCFTRC